jgi:hypothetical protein
MKRVPRLLGLVALAASCACGAAGTSVAPTPDYARPDAWAAWPGRAGAVDTLAPGLPDAGVANAQKVDVFFVHPTTYLIGEAANARYDEPGMTSSQIEQGVLRFQASVFNACCRVYAPHYRQAALRNFRGTNQAGAAAAFELAYSDVARAFDYYLTHENHGRPFIIASHSQGSLHALRLVQERIAGQALAHQLVAAYIIGYALPLSIESDGLALCRSATQTGCLISWNTVKEGVTGGEREHERLVWRQGRYQPVGSEVLACTNPLNWQLGSDAPASQNLGALPGAKPGAALEPVVPGLTGARCRGGMLEVSIPMGQRHGFADALTLFGSYHILDYNLFYANIRRNAQQRVLAYEAVGSR